MNNTILLNLNVSNDSNFEADSGYVFQKLLWTHMCQQHRDLRVLFLGHARNTEEWHPHVSMVPFHDKYDKFSTRFHFDWHKLRSTFENLPAVDLIFNNQPEHTLGFKMLFSSLYGKKVPAVSYYHYLPFHYEKEEIQWDPSQNLHGFSAPAILGRNLEALELSEVGFIGSEFGRGILLKAFRDRYRQALKTDLKVFSPPIEPELFSKREPRMNSHPRILYNQRLYKHYGTERVIEAVQKVAETRDVRFVVTDPTGERSHERNRLDPHVKEFRETLAAMPFVERIHCATRAEYHSLLSGIDLGIAPIKPSALWSMAVADLLAAGKPVLCPKVGAFPELLPNSNELLFRPDGSDLEAKIRTVLDTKPSHTRQEVYRQNVRRYDAPDMAAEMYEHLSPFLT